MYAHFCTTNDILFLIIFTYFPKGEAEAEVCSLRLRNSLLSKDLELAREKEMQLQQELNTEKMAINRLGLPALAKINVRFFFCFCLILCSFIVDDFAEIE